MGLEAHTKWARNRGVILNGIAAQDYPGRGVGIVAEKNLQVGDTLLTVPKSALRTLQTVPMAILKHVGSISVQGLLATEICMDTSEVYDLWRATIPTKKDVELIMPLMWPAPLQALLPPTSAFLLQSQKQKFLADWNATSAAFPTLSHDVYLYNWFIVGTRTFYWPSFDSKTKKLLEHDDCLALVPFADFFNHANASCNASFSSCGYNFTADREFEKGEEVHISYGNHSNDFLLIEYGFILPDNKWDEVCVDKVVLPLFSDQQQELLKEEGYLGHFYIDKATVSYRMEVALRLLCVPSSSWILLAANGVEIGDQYQQAVNGTVLKIVKAYLNDIHRILSQLKNLGCGQASQREILEKRWGQIEAILVMAVQRLES